MPGNMPPTCGEHLEKSLSPKKHAKRSTFSQKAHKKVLFLLNIPGKSPLSPEKHPPPKSRPDYGPVSNKKWNFETLPSGLFIFCSEFHQICLGAPSRHGCTQIGKAGLIACRTIGVNFSIVWTRRRWENAAILPSKNTPGCLKRQVGTTPCVTWIKLTSKLQISQISKFPIKVTQSQIFRKSDVWLTTTCLRWQYLNSLDQSARLWQNNLQKNWNP